jgi:ubiquinone/menaquinone biosynthesis C-methylase UbiE
MSTGPSSAAPPAMWYRDWFRNANYGIVYKHRDDQEAEQMIDLIEKVTGHDPKRHVLDLACGFGRHAISIARRGYPNVTGVDLSPTLLDEARRDAEQEGYSIRFVEADMRQLPDENFDLVTNLFTSFGYFQEDRENAEVIRSVSRHLNPGGWFVIDFFNSRWVRTHLVASDERLLEGGLRLEQTRWIENGRVEKRLLIREKEEAHEYIESVRLYEQPDFEKMFTDAGLRTTECFGSYTGDPYDRERSPRLILFARK